MKNRSLTTKLITLFFSLAVVAYFVFQGWRYFTSQEATTPVYAYHAEQTLALGGYVVRDEEAIDCSESLVELTRTEGERVGKGKLLATVYQDAQTLQSAQELSAMREQLEQLRYAKTAARDTETALRLDSDIEGDIVAMRAALASGNYAALDADVSTLKATVLRREFTYRGSSDLSGRIEALEAQISAAAASVGGASRTIAAPFAGTYSAVTDGYESVLTPAALKELTPEAFDRLTPSAVTGTAGKLIRGEKWYYAAVVGEADAARIVEGRAYRLAISGVSTPLPVTCLSIGRAWDGRCLVVFQSQKYLSFVTMLRAQSAELILESYDGLRVPKNALRIGEDGSTGVYCRIGLQAYFKPVEILYQGEDYCLVTPGRINASTDSQLALLTLRAGDEVIISANDLYNGKVLD